MISLAGLSAVPAGFNAGMQDNLALGAQQRQRLALEALGRTLPLLAGGGGMPMPQAPTNSVGQPPPPQAISALLQALQTRAAQNQGGDPGGAVATPSPQTGAFANPDITPPTTEVNAQAPAQRQPLNLPNTAGIQPGSLRWEQVVNAISRANPGIPPDVLAETVNGFGTLLDQASKERWQQMQDQRLRATAAAKTNPAAKPLLRVQVNDLTGAGEGFTNMTRLNEGWKPEYQTGQVDLGGGKFGVPYLGKGINAAARLGIGSEGSAEAANWWQDYQAFKNTVRHTLFGSALTATEKSEWEAAIVNPSMSPEITKQNLQRQYDAAKRAATKLANTYVAQGKNPQEIEAALGFSLDDLGVAPSAGGQGAGSVETIEGEGDAVEGDTVKGPDGQEYIVRGDQFINRRTGEPWRQ